MQKDIKRMFTKVLSVTAFWWQAGRFIPHTLVNPFSIKCLQCFYKQKRHNRASQIFHLPWALFSSCPAPLPSGSSSSSSSSPEPCRCCCRCWVTCSQNSSMAEHTKEQDPHSHCSPRFSFRGTFPGGGMAFTLEEEEIQSCKDSTKCHWEWTAAQPAKNQ